MTARVLAGTDLAAAIRSGTASRAAALAAAGRQPVIAVLTATDDPASAAYVSSITRSAGKVGIDCQVTDLGGAATEASIRSALHRLNDDKRISGVILQTPVPDRLSASDLASGISPEKDIDGASPFSLGCLLARLPAFPPATAEAVVRLLDFHEVALAGLEAVIVGRSTVVGKPLAHLLLDRDATVTVAHSRTRDLQDLTARADLVVAAVGRPHLLTPGYFRAGAIVVDVGTNPTPDGGITGDVAPAAAGTAGALSPVPRGVGPVTTALLLDHAVRAAERS